MCDDSNCQLQRSEILGLQCLRLQRVTDSLTNLQDAQNKGYIRTLGDFVEQVKTPTDQKKQARQAYGGEQYDALKRSLPVWICCGIGGTKQDSIEPNGLVTIDIDHIDGYERQVKNKLCELPFVALCCLSISGHGVYALAYAPDHVRDAERVKSEIYAVVANYLSATIDLKLSVKDSNTTSNAANIDNCTDISRKRFEPFDTEIYVANKVKAFEPISALIDKKWNNSRIKKLAEMLGYIDVTPNHASVGALLALAAASAKLTLWDWSLFTKNEAYQARFGGVVLGDTGDGKKRIDSAIQIIADKFNVQCGNSKSTADMAYRASLSCNTLETDESKKQVWKEKQVRDVKPFIEVNDEVYATISANKMAQYAMDKAAQRRLLLDTHYNPPTTKKESLPDYKFTPCYQYICFSQFESYAEAVAGDRTDTGDGRRELLCELPRYDADGLPLEVALFKARMATPASDLDGVYQALNDAYTHNIDRINASHDGIIESLTVREIEGKSKYPEFPAIDYESRPLCQFTFFRCLDGLNDTNKKDAFTHFANIATLSAYIEQRSKITTSDILIAAAIARASFALRDKLQERCTEITLNDGCDKQIAWLNKYWEVPGKSVSMSKYKKAKTNNGIGLSKLTQEIVERWEKENIVDYYKDKNNKYFRRGTQEELESIAKDLEIEAAIKSISGSQFNELTLKWNANHAHDEQYATRIRPPFNQDEPESQRIRVCEMVNKCLEGGKCGYFVKGQRQTTLYRLRNVLTNQCMWGEAAIEVLSSLARDAGLPEKEIRRTLEKPI